MSKDQVSVIAKDLDADVTELKGRGVHGVQLVTSNALACLAFPPSHRKRLRTDNVQERRTRRLHGKGPASSPALRGASA